MYEERYLQIDIDNLKMRLEEAKKLFHEAVDSYPTEQDPNLWTSRVREWIKKNELVQNNRD